MKSWFFLNTPSSSKAKNNHLWDITWMPTLNQSWAHSRNHFKSHKLINYLVCPVKVQTLEWEWDQEIQLPNQKLNRLWDQSENWSKEGNKILNCRKRFLCQQWKQLISSGLSMVLIKLLRNLKNFNSCSRRQRKSSQSSIKSCLKRRVYITTRIRICISTCKQEMLLTFNLSMTVWKKSKE